MSVTNLVLVGGSAMLIGYVYAGYPLLLGALTVGRRGGESWGGEEETGEGAGEWPQVSLIIPAYNEEQVIARKIRNSCDLDYPPSRLEIVVVSDGSGDGTEKEARDAVQDRVRLVFREDREGKTACLNAVLPTLRGDLVVFTDANAFFQRDALKALVRPFQDPGVGCVMGELEYERDASLNASLGEGLYWRYENLIKRLESRLGSTIVGNGAIYGMRRTLCRVLPTSAEADVVNPLLALTGGWRVVFEERARCRERASATVREEFSRKTRIITNQIGSYLYAWRRAGPLPAGALFQIVSHKVLRWLVPVFLAALCAGSWRGAAASPVLGGLLAAQVIFYGLAVSGWITEWLGRRVPRLFFLPFYFCAVNAASVKGMFDFFRGRRRIVWDKAASTR